MNNYNNSTRTREYENTRILLSHGSGGTQTRNLIRDLFKKHFDNEFLSPLSDSALLNLGTGEIAFTTDSYVINPVIFAGGNIGKLAVCGTVNDLAVSGARPLYLSCGFIIEEGLDFALLEEIVISMAETAREARVKIVTGDTKVVDHGAADKIFINTAGIGQRISGLNIGPDKIKSGDKIIINGCIGDHGMAIMAERNGLTLPANIKSDCAPLNGLIESLPYNGIKFMRDPTRGGVATTLCEIAESARCDIEIYENSLPVSDGVKSIAEILGIDPLYSANEGKVLIVTSAARADAIVAAMKNNPLGVNAAVIGEIKAASGGNVQMRTEIGTRRRISMLSGAQLPRIC